MVYRYDSKSSGEKTLNSFRNDGSFLETFKKLQEAQKAKAAGVVKDAMLTKEEGEGSTTSNSDQDSSKPKKPLPFVGKRRGSRVLPTGKVKKLKSEADESEETPKDAWSLYLAEVRRYRETTCEEDGKTRPLVK